MKEDFTKHINEEISDDIKKFVDDEVFGNKEYLFIEKLQGMKRGHCTKCHSEYFLKENYKHNTSGICPSCGAKVQVKHSRYGRKNCTNDACFYYFEKSIIDPEVIVCKGYYVVREYTKDYKMPDTEYLLEAIYIFGDKLSKMLKLNYSNFYGSRWSEKKSVFDFNQGWLAPKYCYISRDSIQKATIGTKFQYIPKDLLQGYHSTVKVFDQFSKYGWLEQLFKMGFKNIVECKLRGDNLFSCLNYRGKDVFKILKLSRKDVKDILNLKDNISPLFLCLYQMQNKDRSGLSASDIRRIEDKIGYNLFKLKAILKYTTMRKAFRYLEKQYEKYSKKYSNMGSVVTTWSDYIENCNDLNLDLANEKNLFPKDVFTSHQNTMKQVKVKANQLFNEKILKRFSSINDRYYFECNNLVIRAAESTEELITEGSTLSHCVATNYIKPYANGITNILLIRNNAEPDKPYYTVEIKNNEIIQIQGKSHSNPNKEVQEFIEKFKHEKLKLKKDTSSKIPA